MRARKLALIGFGSQGRAWAAKLERRTKLVIGLRKRSRSRRAARRRGYSVALPERAVAGCGVVAILVPDQAGRKVFARLKRHLHPDCLVVFAAGYPLVYPRALEHAGHDVVLVAPHGPGRDLEAGARMSAFLAVACDSSGRAHARARALARWLGLSPVYDTTPGNEALGDLFGEQALLCGGLVGLTAEVARTMTRGGIPRQHAWLETVGQLEQLAALLRRQGVERFWQEISDCAAAGSAAATPRLFTAGFRRSLQRVWDEIESGRFARRFEREGRPVEMPNLWTVVASLERALAGGEGRAGSLRNRAGSGQVAGNRRSAARGKRPKKKGGRSRPSGTRSA